MTFYYQFSPFNTLMYKNDKVVLIPCLFCISLVGMHTMLLLMFLNGVIVLI